MHRPRQSAAVVLVTAALCQWPALTWACGACFNPPPAPGAPVIASSVVQDAERVFFVRDEATKTSHVWVEVRYSGLASEFGWVLPVPKVPKVSVGTVLLFDAFDTSLGRRYGMKFQPPENCLHPEIGCLPCEECWWDDSFLGDTAAADASGGGGVPPQAPKIEILASGSTGPYDYQIIKGNDGSALNKWLNDHKYATPAKATPILNSHIAKGDVFVAIKLANGKGVNAIRPIVLAMPDAEPCVPLRLTAIAAAEEMSVIVNIAGPGRAVVKNHLDVELNPFRLKLLDKNAADAVYWAVDANTQSPGNYAQVLAHAIDEAGGRAFVTEGALPTKTALVYPPVGQINGKVPMDAVTAATNLYELALSGFGPVPTNAELADAVALPAGLTQAFPGQDPLQVIAELRSCGNYWNQFIQFGDSFGGQVDEACKLPSGKFYWITQLQSKPVDGAKVAAAIENGIIDPLFKGWSLAKQAQTVTRLAMRISADEMDRDPVFAFNPALPDVEPYQQIVGNQVCPNGWVDPADKLQMRLSVDGLGTWVFDGNNAVDPRFAKAPFALSMAVLEETGPPLAIDPSQAVLISTAIAGALPGKPSLPAGLVVKPVTKWVPPPSDPLVTKLGPWPGYVWPGWSQCTPKPGWQQGKLPGQADAQPDTSEVQPEDTGAWVPDVDVGVVDIQAGEGGPVPGIDAAGGWAEPVAAEAGNGGQAELAVSDLADAASKPATPAPKPDDGGCAAGRGQSEWVWTGLFGLCAVSLVRRRHGQYQAESD